MRDLHEINMNEGGMPVLRKPPTSAEVSAFESHFGVVLPDDYVAFLRHSNGGHPEKNAYRPSGSIESALWGVSRFYYLANEESEPEGVWSATKSWRRELPMPVIAIGNDGGGNQILLAFDTVPPRVILCIHDEGMRTIHVADSFGEFIDSLTDDPDMI